MSIAIACDDCGSKYKVQDAAAGKKVKCKKCGNLMAIPGAGAKVAVAPAAARPAATRPAAAAARSSSPRPTAPARPAAAAAPSRPSAPRSVAPMKPTLKRPAPPPPSDEASLDDLAALADGEILPPEELPMESAPAVTRAPAAAASPAMPLGYAVPKVKVIAQPAYIEKYGNILMMATFFVPLAKVILSVIMLAIMMGGINMLAVGFMLLGALIGVGILTGVFVPLMLSGVKIAAKIMKFDVEDGYKRMLMVVGGVSLLSLVFEFIVQAVAGTPAAAAIVAVLWLGLALTAMVWLTKDSFVIDWPQAIVATIFEFVTLILGVIGIVVVLTLALGGLGGVLRALMH